MLYTLHLLASLFLVFFYTQWSRINYTVLIHHNAATRKLSSRAVFTNVQKLVGNIRKGQLKYETKCYLFSGW